MKRARLWIPGVLLATQVLACDDGPTGNVSLIRPGTTIDGILVTTGDSNLRLDEFCSGLTPSPDDPNVLLDECVVPADSRVQAGPGWFAIDQMHLEQNWVQFEWEMYIDGRPVDLAAFGTRDGTLVLDFDGDGAPEEYADRGYDVVLDGVQGTHSLRYVLIIKADVDDGLGVTPAARYEIRTTLRTES